jgi:hypothetical protein
MMTTVEKVVIYTKKHPDTLPRDIAVHFCLSQSYVTLIIREAGLSKPWRSGRPPKQVSISKAGHTISRTNEEYKWESILHYAGLGMDRGVQLGGKRLQYGYDPLLAEPGDSSITADVNNLG